MIGLDKARPARPAGPTGPALTISRFSRFPRFPFPPCIVFPVLISHDTPVRRKIAGPDGGYPAICVRFPFFSDFRYVWTNHVRGRVRGCAKLCEVSVFFLFLF